MNSICREPIPTKEERAAKLRASERAAEWDRLRDALTTLGWCFASTIVSALCVGMSAHVNELRTAQMWFYGGLALGYAGNLIALYLAYKRGEDRGDW